MSGQTPFNPYSEPASGQMSPGGPRPNIPNHLVKAIISTLCCCLPFGIVAIVFAAQVNGKLDSGDYAGAQKSSEQAKFWGNIVDWYWPRRSISSWLSLQVIAAMAANQGHRILMPASGASYHANRTDSCGAAAFLSPSQGSFVWDTFCYRKIRQENGRHYFPSACSIGRRACIALDAAASERSITC